MQSTTVLVNFHSDCPKCGAGISGCQDMWILRQRKMLQEQRFAVKA
jgi:hypothetical protein